MHFQLTVCCALWHASWFRVFALNFKVFTDSLTLGEEFLLHIHPSIYLFSLIQSRVLQLVSRFLLGDPEAFLGQRSSAIPPVSSEHTLGCSPSWTCQESLRTKRPKKHPNQIPEPPELCSAGCVWLKVPAALLPTCFGCRSSSLYRYSWNLVPQMEFLSGGHPRLREVWLLWAAAWCISTHNRLILPWCLCLEKVCPQTQTDTQALDQELKTKW